VLGAVLIAIGLIVVLPMLFWAGIGAVAAVLSVVLTDHAEQTHEGSELIATNV
jgi:energy-converting hydrogenase Eha subunit A